MSTVSRDRTTTGSGVEIAYRDHGGDGPPIVLVPGAGRTLIDFAPMLPVLLERHRVVTTDLRNHGLSGDGPWGADEVAGDVRAVVEACELERPAVAGHSLGGMIAALYAERFDCAAAVNIDGHGQGRPDQYLGMSEADVLARMAEMREIGERMTAETPAFTAEQLPLVKEAAAAQLSALGLPSDGLAEAFDRSLVELPDGTFRTRPGPEQTASLLAWLADLDLFALYRRVPSPLLVYNATRVDEAPPGSPMPAWAADVMRAYRAGLARDLEALSRECPTISVQTIDATHALIIEQPAVVARQVSDFVLAAT